jgi:hypothetical protein
VTIQVHAARKSCSDEALKIDENTNYMLKSPKVKILAAVVAFKTPLPDLTT